MTALTLACAQDIIAGAFAHAGDLKLKPLTVAVLDAGGHLIALARQDGGSNLRPEIAIAKANGALSLGISSRKIGDMAAERSSFVAALGLLAQRGLVPAAGGLIVTDADGHTLGAVGATGDLSDNDEACVIAGVAQVGLKAML